MKRMLAVCLAICLCGCAGVGSNSEQRGDLGEVTLSVAPPVSTDGKLHGLSELRRELNARQDQTTQALTGLGLQVREIRNEFDAFAKVTAELEIRIRNDVRVQGEVSASALTQLENRLYAQMKLDAKLTALNDAVLTLTAQVDAMATAQVTAIAGIGNDVRKSVSEIKSTAGRDVQTTQFTQDMAAVMERGFKANVEVVGYLAGGAVLCVLVLAGVSIWLMERSRQRAVTRELCAHSGGAER